MKMEWSNEDCLALIDQYEQHPMLWDPKHKFYFSKTKKEDEWETIANNLNIETAIIKKKMSSLLGSFRAQRSKSKKTIGTGKGRSDIYVSKWFAFERMKFLLDRDEANSGIDTETQESVESEATDSNDSSPKEGNILRVNNNNNTTESNDTQAEQTVDYLNDHQMLDNIEKPLAQKKLTSTKPASKKRKLEEDLKLNEAYKIMKDAQARCFKQDKVQDRFDIYGQHIASKLRTYSARTEIMVEHAINNTLFGADIGNYDRMSSGTANQPNNLASTCLVSPTPSQYSSCSDHPSTSACTSQTSNSMATYVKSAQEYISTFNPITYSTEY